MRGTFLVLMVMVGLVAPLRLAAAAPPAGPSVDQPAPAGSSAGQPPAPVAAPAPPRTSGPAGLSSALGPRRTFTLRGFSMCPPAGAQEARKGESVDLALYNVVDPSSGQVLMMMRIWHSTELKETVTVLSDYANKLRQQLVLDQDFHQEGYTATATSEPTTPPPAAGQTTTIAGKPAIDLRGNVGRGNVERFRRDFWVQVEPAQSPNQFLVIQFIGPIAQREGILRASQACINSLQFFDPTAIRASLEAARERAEQLLKALTREKVLSVLSREDYWMAAVRGDRVVGFMHFTESIAYQGKQEGVQVMVQSAFLADDGSRVLSRQEMFSTADRVNERWEQRGITLGADGNDVGRHRQFAARQHNQLVVQTVTGPHDTISQVKQIPESICLPLAFSPLVGRLVEKTPGAQYAFAQYDPANEEVAMRVVRVVGPANVNIGAQAYGVTEIEDRPDVDGPLTKLYIDAAGLPLKWVTTDAAGRQTVVQRTTAAAIAQRFAAELKRFEMP